MNCSIRRMEVADVPAVSALDHACFSLPWPERSFTYEVTSNENSIPLVAVTVDETGNSHLAGFIVVWLIIDEAHIGTIGIDDQYRRKGIAEALIRTAFSQAKERGALMAFLEVRAGNIGAIRLYEKLGFATDGVRRGYYQDNHEDAILMSLSSLDQI